MNKKIIAPILGVLLLALFALGVRAVQAAPPQQDIFPDFDPQQVARFAVQDVATKRVVAFRREGNAWNAEEKANQGETARVLPTLRMLAALSRAGNAIAGSETIPFTPTVQVTITLTETNERVLQVGQPVPDKLNHYAKMLVPADPRLFPMLNAVVNDLRNYVEERAQPQPPPAQPTPNATGTTAAQFAATAVAQQTQAAANQTATAGAQATAVANQNATAVAQQTQAAAQATATAEAEAEAEQQAREAAEGEARRILIIAGVVGGFVLLLIALAVILILRRPPSTAPYLELAANPKIHFDLKKDALTIGRGKECDVRIEERIAEADTVSHWHARLERVKNRWMVMDGVKENAPSTNGVFVNGARTRENYLEEDDHVRFGDVEFIFHAQRVAPPAQKGVSR